MSPTDAPGPHDADRLTAPPPPAPDPVPDTPPDAMQVRRRRLLFRATHRGTTETDRLVGGFVAERLDRLDTAEIAELEAVMDLPDVDLAEWLTGRRPIPDLPQAALLTRMRDAALLRAARIADLMKGAGR